MTDNNSSIETLSPPGTGMRWISRARIVILLVFALLTLYGGYYFIINDWKNIASYWLARRGLLLACFLLSACDVFTDGFIWTNILRQHGIRLGLARGLFLFLSGYAGYLMPVQLGRFFRGAELSRLYGVPLATATTTELTLLGFVVVSCVSIFMCAALWPWFGIFSLIIPLVMVPSILYIVEIVYHWVPKLPFQLPKGYWRRPFTIFLCFLSSNGWMLNGLILYLIFRDVAEGLQLHQTLMIVTSNLFIGIMSGLPGGMGITETYIGGMMYWLSTPPEHLVLAVAAFRIITFWLWIPLGWVALFLNGLLFGYSRGIPAKK
jgi:uncharacterized membrane protein YbhN (UPF0104 family)